MEKTREEYTKLKEQFTRRIERLYTILEKANTVLLVTDTAEKFDMEIPFRELIVLQKNLAKMYPTTDINILFTQYKQELPKEKREIIEVTDSITVTTDISKPLISEIFHDNIYGLREYVAYNGFTLSKLGYELAKEINK